MTLEFAPRGLVSIFDDIFVERGGAPAFFLVENLTLSWPGGIEGLRLPVFAFFVLALLGAALVARELGTPAQASLLPPLFALAPLAVELATFARMYTLFVAVVLLATWLLLRAARRDDRAAWILAGAATGSLVYIHPIAPLYIVVALASAWLAANRPAGSLLRAARPGLVVAALVGLPYVYALALLSRRYGVASTESSLVEGGTGRSVLEESILALTPGKWAGAAVFLALALAGQTALLRRKRRTGLAVGLWIVAPLAFFTLVPAETNFFARYLFPALPFFLLLVVIGALLAGHLAPRPFLGAGAIVIALLAWEGSEVVSRQQQLRDLRLPASVAALERLGEEAVVFSSSGSELAGRPAHLVDTYLALELPSLERVEELPAIDPRYEPDVAALGMRAVRSFLRSEKRDRVGVWPLAGSPGRISATERRLQGREELETERISPRLLLVRSARLEDARTLVEQGLVVRRAWLASGHDRWTRTLTRIDRRALRGGR